MTWALLEAGLPCAQDEAAWRAGDRPAAGGGLRQHYATSVTQQVTAGHSLESQAFPFSSKKAFSGVENADGLPLTGPQQG